MVRSALVALSLVAVLAPATTTSRYSLSTASGTSSYYGRRAGNGRGEGATRALGSPTMTTSPSTSARGAFAAAISAARLAATALAVTLPALACSGARVPSEDPAADWELTGYVWQGSGRDRESLGPCVSEPWRATEASDHVVAMERLERLRARIGDRVGQRYTIDRRGSLLRWRAVGRCRRADGTPLRAGRDGVSEP